MRSITLIFLAFVLFPFSSCRDNNYEGTPEPFVKPMAEIPLPVSIDTSPEPIIWEGTDLGLTDLYKLNSIINSAANNPSLKSPCKPPSAGSPTLNYAEHYRCGAITVLESPCVLWEEVVPLVNSEYPKSNLSVSILQSVMNKAVNYGNVEKPICRCQKTPAHVVRYRIQSTSYINEILPEKPLTRRLWVMTTYNCCGAC